jgi:hypothetical protein
VPSSSSIPRQTLRRSLFQDSDFALEGTRVFLGGRYSEKEVINFGSILDSSTIGVRSSEQIKAQPNCDATQLERAQLQAKARDPSNFLGTKVLPKFTLDVSSNSEIESRASKLGFSLGSSPSKIKKSINSLKDNDISCTLFMLQINEEICNNMLKGNSSFIVEESNQLCNDLLHEEEDETVADHKDLFMRSIKPKRAYKKQNLETTGTILIGLWFRRMGQLKIQRNRNSYLN